MKALILMAAFVSAGRAEKTVLSVGHFPNLTHAQAVIAHGLSRQGKGWFEQRLGPEVQLRWFVYNAGPSAMEALLAGSIDMTYVGPNPAVNAHVKTKGAEVRVVSGACSGGAALVVRGDGRIKTDADFRGKKLATPQLGNTQDVAARAWLLAKGLRTTLTGGDALVVPTPNPDQLLLFKKGDIDAVWTVEPWVSRLELEGGGKVYLKQEGRYTTTHLVASAAFIAKRRELLKKWLKAQRDLTQWIRKHPAEAKALLNAELERETTRGLAPAVLDRAWARIELTEDPLRESVLESAEDAFRVGLLSERPDLSRLWDPEPLREAR